MDSFRGSRFFLHEAYIRGHSLATSLGFDIFGFIGHPWAYVAVVAYGTCISELFGHSGQTSAVISTLKNDSLNSH